MSKADYAEGAFDGALAALLIGALWFDIENLAKRAYHRVIKDIAREITAEDD